MGGIWDEVEMLRKEGKSGFRINIPKLAQVSVKLPPGRPKTSNPERPYAHYRDPRVKKSGGKSRPYCLRFNCIRPLKRNDVYVCSTECAELLREEANERLEWLAQREKLMSKLASEWKKPRGVAPKGLEARKSALPAQEKRQTIPRKRKKKLTTKSFKSTVIFIPSDSP